MKAIPHFENKYFINEKGEIVSYARYPYGKRIKTKIDKDGYEIVVLHNHGIRYDKKVHRLMMETFYPDLEPSQVNHIDGIKNNNRLSNLEYCTNSENQLHRANVLKTGGVVKCVAIYPDGREVEAHSIKALAEKIGFNVGTVRDRLYKNRPTREGIVFKRK